MRREELSEVGHGCSVDALISENTEFVMESEMDRQPVQGLEHRGHVIIFAPPRQESSNTVLDVLKLRQALTRDPDEEGIAVIQIRALGVQILLCPSLYPFIFTT